MSTPTTKMAQRVVRRFLGGRPRVAGEVRFIKDNAGDASQWAYGLHGPSERHINHDYKYNPRHLKPLALCLRSTSAALGHVMSGYSRFAKMKSADLSPDGALGGRGYIQKISDMRRQYMNIVEALSALMDTLYDEVKAPHWANITRDRLEIQDIVEDVEEIKEDPESWAQEEEAEMDEGRRKTASSPLGFQFRLSYHHGREVKLVDERKCANFSEFMRTPSVLAKEWIARKRCKRGSPLTFTSSVDPQGGYWEIQFSHDKGSFSKTDVCAFYGILGV